MWKTICVTAALLCFACGDGDGDPEDASGPSRDTGTLRDTGIRDGSSDDAGTQDAGDAATGPDASLEAWSCPGAIVEVTGVADRTDIAPAIDTAIASARDGDCIVVPAGEFYLSTTVTTDKKVSLLGHGRGSGGTWIHRSESMPEGDLAGAAMFVFNIDSREASGMVFAGLRLSSKLPQAASGGAGSLATDFGIRLRGAVDFVVTDCHFENFGYAALQIRHFDDLSRGLIYDSEFDHNAKGDGQGLGYGVVLYGDDETWVDDPLFGSDNFIFVEDSRFTRHRHALAAGGAARYVIRHSEIVDSLFNAAGIDAHEGRNVGLGGSNHFSTRAVEVYGNVLRNDHFNDGAPLEPGGNLNNLGLAAIGIRGGEALIHDNQISGFLNGILLIVFDGQDDVWSDYSYPYPYQIGWLSGEALGADHRGVGADESSGDVFEWNNDFTPYAPTGQERKYWLDSSNQLPGGLVEGRDYHLDTMRPGYSPFTYPHPRRINWQGVGAGSD